MVFKIDFEDYTFMKIKKNRRLEIVYEKKSSNFLSFIYLALIKLVI